jgi:hypothetical protein
VYENPSVTGDNVDMSNVFKAVASDRAAAARTLMNELLDALIQPENYIGEGDYSACPARTGMKGFPPRAS